jgi:hypothetical protein
MAKTDVIRSHVHTLMESYLGTDELIVDDDGQVPVRWGTAVYRVRVGSDANPHVEVYAVAVEDVDADPGLFEALNTINRRLSHARAFWVDRCVVVAGQLLGSSLTLESLGCTCDEVAAVADSEGVDLAGTFGGHVAVPADPDDSDDSDDDEEHS